MAENQKPTFFAGGVVRTDFYGLFDTVGAMVLQPDGKILVTGTSSNLAEYGGDAITVIRYNSDGSVDQSFGNNGVVAVHLGALYESGRDIALQSNGKIVVTGFSGWKGAGDDKFAVVKLNSDGSLDTTFSGDGSTTTGFGFLGGSAYSAAIQSDGKIIAAGYADVFFNSEDFALVRYNPDGSLDNTFGGDGQVTTNITDYSTDNINDVLLQSDGKIVAVGFTDADITLVRYNQDGSLDTSYGINGKSIVDFGLNIDQVYYGKVYDKAYGAVLQPDGKVLAVGSVNNRSIALLRLNQDGSLDTSFDGDGRLLTSIASGETGESVGKAVAIQPDGKILVTGSANFNNSGNDFALTRFNTDGSLDTSFGINGSVIIDSSVDNLNFLGQGQSVVVQPDGKILVAGDNGYDFFVYRFYPDGTIDKVFGVSNTLDGKLGYLENGHPVLLDDSVLIFDADLAALNGGSGDYNGASITLSRRGGANPDDKFESSNATNVIFDGTNLRIADGVAIGTVANANGTLKITFNSNATQEKVNIVLSSIMYSNASDTPPDFVQIDWVFDDGNNGAQGTGGASSVSGTTDVYIYPVNDAPKLIKEIPDQTLVKNSTYTYTLPANSFIDPEGDQIYYYADSSDGSSLPSWLSFDPFSKTFSGTPTSNGIYNIRLTAFDEELDYTSEYFTLRVDNADSIGSSNNNQALIGSAFVDFLKGGNGNDILDGGWGKDTLMGGLGDDRYVLDISATGKYEDKITELNGQGNDTLIYRNTNLTAQSKAITLKLVKNFESIDISQTGTMNFNLTGDAGNNILTGNAGNNVIDGGKGADTMIGGAGNDTYILDNGGDTVLEASGEGIDQVNIKLASNSIYDTYSLDPNIENAVLTNKVAFNLEGNELSNYLKGNSAANWIYGSAGNDAIDASKGKDTLQGGTGNDVLLGGAGADTFVWRPDDLGVAGTPSNDITDFKVKDKDVLDLRDLLSGHSEDLSNYLDISLEGTNTKIHISTSGGFANGIYNASQEDATITVTNNLFLSTKTSDETSLLQTLINKHQLLTDY